MPESKNCTTQKSLRIPFYSQQDPEKMKNSKVSKFSTLIQIFKVFSKNLIFHFFQGPIGHKMEF